VYWTTNIKEGTGRSPEVNTSVCSVQKPMSLGKLQIIGAIMHIWVATRHLHEDSGAGGQLNSIS
jgi:hypothetical protein